VRQDGRSASLTAPSGLAQRGLLAEALLDAGTSAGELSLNEAHGTGTSLGDPIEAGSLSAVLLEGCGLRSAPLAWRGVKASAGHAEAAAGSTGLVQLAVGLCFGSTSSNAQLRVLNPYVGASLHGEECLLPVGDGALAQASVRGGASSFGYSGTLAHGMLCINHVSHWLTFARQALVLSGLQSLQHPTTRRGCRRVLTTFLR